MKKFFLLSFGAVMLSTAVSAQLKILTNGSAQGSSTNGVLRIESTQGYWGDFGPQNDIWCHLITGNNYFYFNKRLTLGVAEIEGYTNKDLKFCAGSLSRGNSTRMTILASNGYVGIGYNYSPAYQLDVNGNIRTTGTLYQTSDERLKKDIKSLETSKVKRIYQLSAKSYTKDLLPENMAVTSLAITSPDSVRVNEPVNVTDTTHHIGFLAQELQLVYPELVKQSEDGYYSVDYLSLIPVLVEALKEQNARIEELEAQVAKAKAK